jgi:hypothetical protein
MQRLAGASECDVPGPTYPAIAVLGAVGVATLLAGACRVDTATDTSRGANEAVGAIAGRELSVEGASFCPSGFGSPDDVTLVLSSRTDDCDAHRKQITRPDATTLTLHLVKVGGAGTFQVKRGARGAGDALARFSAVGAECEESLVRDADEGTVTVTAIDASTDGFIKGSFDVVFDGERLRGDFDTSVCTVDYFCGQSTECAK